VIVINWEKKREVNEERKGDGRGEEGEKKIQLRKKDSPPLKFHNPY